MRKEEYYGLINKVNNDFLHRIKTLREQLNDDDIKISFDEWNAWYAWYRGGSVSEGIFAAAFMHMLFQNSDRYGVELACYFESVNEGTIQVHPDRVHLTPAGQALSIMKHHANAMVCALQEDVTATRKDDVLTCTLINRSYDESKVFTIPKVGEMIVSTLYSSDDVVPNTVFEQNVLPIEQNGKIQKIILSGHSIALVQIKLSEEL